MNNKYFESATQSKDLLKQAIAFIGQHNLSANPVNYAVCYDYILGIQPLLRQAVDKTISENILITDQLMGEWFESFVSGQDVAHLTQSHSDLINILEKFSASAILAEKNVNEYNQSLHESENDLSGASVPIENIVGHLLVQTKKMQVSMEIMRQQIQESKLEINVLHERLEQSTKEALTDPLTGLTNRKGLTKAIDEIILADEKLKSYLCLLMLDIDHFKKINDTFGHLLGDRVIKVVAATLRNQIKGKDTAARYGGEEFCILLPDTELPDAIKVAENIRKAVEKTRIKRSSDNQEICRMTISIGVARYNPDEPISSLFERADNALYQSKNDGRNRVTSL